MLNSLIPFFAIAGTNSYPDNFELFSEMQNVTFNNTSYWLCNYTGAMNLETGPDKFTDYDAATIDKIVTITIEGDKAYNVMNLGETLNFTATFSDASINATIPVSIVNRENIHVANALVTIVDGVGTGTFTPDKAIDYFVTEEAINFHVASLNTTLVLDEPFYVRVVQP